MSRRFSSQKPRTKNQTTVASGTDTEPPEQGPPDFFGRHQIDRRSRAHKGFCRLQEALRQLQDHLEHPNVVEVFRTANESRTKTAAGVTEESYVETAFRVGCDRIKTIAGHLANVGQTELGCCLHLVPTIQLSIVPATFNDAWESAARDLAASPPFSAKDIGAEIRAEFRRAKRNAPDLNGVSGFVADSAAELAQDVLREVERLDAMARETAFFCSDPESTSAKFCRSPSPSPYGDTIRAEGAAAPLAEKLEEPVWPPDAGWHFRPGQYAYGAKSFDLGGRMLKLLKRLAEARRPLTKADMQSENAEKEAVRVDLANLRRILRANHSLLGDPIPHGTRSAETTWKLDIEGARTADRAKMKKSAAKNKRRISVHRNAR